MSSWVSPPFPFLKELDVAGWTFSRIPRWIGGLDNLHTLRFGVKEVSNFTWDDIGTIGMLPNLIILYLRVEGDVPAEGIVISGSTGFKHLQEFYLQIKSTSHLAFEEGAMPNLRDLALSVIPKECYRATAPVGLEHLASLQRIFVYGGIGRKQTLPQNINNASFEAFCAMFREAITGLPTQLTFHSSYALVHR
ncbi:unnamed protein product [Miscanthus lutarioriparius]|uniref:Disease resistance R13L4/SHOC-2-like LRR domain-containing protein n=1 Tax=Miscanthus lutarioriparius TaxID=422564 RepID=A0A811QVK5_9POAL|nr:unnamed protein product [Miscanthus lutarioriparius]